MYDLGFELSLEGLFSTKRKEGTQWIEEYIRPPAVLRLPHVHQHLNTITGSISPLDYWRTEHMLRPLMRHPMPGLTNGWAYGGPVRAACPRHAPEESAGGGAAEHANFQMKVLPWTAQDLEQQLNPRTQLQSKGRQPVKVMASLVDDPYALAALARCSEVFLAEKLILRSRKVPRPPPVWQSARCCAVRFHTAAGFEPSVDEQTYFVRGQIRGENFVFQFGVEIFPTQFFQGTSRSLCISGGGSQVLLRCRRQSVFLSRPFIFAASV